MPKEFYLFYQSDDLKAGLNHHASNLQALLKEAYLLNRTAIIPKFLFDKTHFLKQSQSGYLDKYYNFSDITIKGNKIKTILQHKITLDATKTLTIQERQKIIPAENKKYQFVVRKMKNCLWRIHLPFNYGKSQQGMKFIMPYSQTIEQTAKKSIEFLKNYNAVHIRRNDSLAIFIALNYYTSAKRIRKKLNQTIAKGTKLFVMSDERKHGYFDILKQDYSVYFWYDIPCIKSELGEHVTDNFLLFAIERTIWNSASVKIHTMHRNGYTGGDYLLYPQILYRISKNKFVLLFLSLLNKQIRHKLLSKYCYKKIHF